MTCPAPRIQICNDTEAHATSFNQGFDAAVAQGLTEDPAFAEEWLHDRIRKEVALAFNEAADHLLELWTAGSPELPRGAVAIATWLRERTAEPLELELPTPPPDPPAPDCCCSWGAAVTGEYPENGCADCPVHQGGLGETRRCRRHRKAHQNRSTTP